MRLSDVEALELVDAIVAAVDVDRADEVRRTRVALECLGLAGAFNDELRLAGVPSASWQRCQFCSEVIDEFEAAQEVV